MNPLEYIEEGIHDGDWEQVCKGYELLTGIGVAPPDNNMIVVKNALKQISKIISTTSDILRYEQKETQEKKTHKTKTRKKKTRKKKTKIVNEEDTSLQLDVNNRTVVQKETGEVQLITNVPDPKEVADNKIAAEKSRKNKNKLNRQTNTIYKVECNECEKPFDSDRPQGQMGQKCPSCLRNLKKKFA